MKVVIIRDDIKLELKDIEVEEIYRGRQLEIAKKDLKEIYEDVFGGTYKFTDEVLDFLAIELVMDINEGDINEPLIDKVDKILYGRYFNGYYDDELSNLYLYGNTEKDAIAMGTVSLSSEQLKQYKEQYPVLINVKEKIDQLNEGRDGDTF